MRISDWSSDVCSSDLLDHHRPGGGGKMEPDHPSPARGQKASGDGEHDERHVHKHDEIRQYPVGHCASPPGRKVQTRLFVTCSSTSFDRWGAAAIRSSSARISLPLAWLNRRQRPSGASSEEHTSELQSLM